MLNPDHVNWEKLSTSAYLAHEALERDAAVPESTLLAAKAAAREVWDALEAVASYYKAGR